MEQTHEEEYTYDELESPSSIRVLKLLPGAHGTSLTFSLIQVRREDNPEYEAVSYTWGTPVFSQRIQELSTGKHIRITENLFDALEAFRYKNRNRVLWVDAVCINQRDNKEKNHQVAQMAEIYRGSNVLVWLGKDDATQAFRRLRELYDMGFPELPPRDWRGSLMDGRNRHPITQLFKRDWFNRVWIVQEVALCQNSDSIRWSGLYGLVNTQQRSTHDSDLYNQALYTEGLRDQIFSGDGFHNILAGLGTVRNITDARSHQHGHPAYLLSLLEYCRMFRSAACSIERDRVYAFLGLADDSLSILPDYSCPEEQVWKELAFRLLNKGDLTVLHYSGLAMKEHTDGMSFVPDPKYLQFVTTKLIRYRRPGDRSSNWFQSRRSDFSVQVQVLDGDSVSLRGLLVDVVTDLVVCTLPSSDTENPTPGCTMEETYERSAKMYASRPFPYSEDFISVLARAIVMDNLLDAVGVFTSEELCGLLVLNLRAEILADGRWGMLLERCVKDDGVDTLWLKDPDGSLGNHTIINGDSQFYGRIQAETDDDGTSWAVLHDSLVELAQKYSRTAYNCLRRRCALLTAEGYFGLGPKCMEPGDVVVIFDGGLTPFVLRPVPRETGRDGRPTEYQLVGDCYLEGWMYGGLFGHKVVDDVNEALPATDGKGKDKSEGTDTSAAKSSRLSRIHAKATRVGFSLRERLGKSKSNGQQKNSEPTRVHNNEPKVLKHTSFILR